MREQCLGNFDIGFEPVRLVVREGTGGDFGLNPGPTIYIGINTPKWGLVHESLLHEAAEFVAFRLGVRFTPDLSLSSSHENYFFAFDHKTFSDICAKVTLFTIPSLPLLRTAWETVNSPRKKIK